MKNSAGWWQNMNSKPSILMVSEHNCIRVTKEAFVLDQRNYPMSLMTIHKNLRHFGFYKNVCVWSNKIQFEDAIIKAADGVDIIHVHNEPTWHLPVIREILG